MDRLIDSLSLPSFHVRLPLPIPRVCQAALALAQLGADINATVLPQAAELSEREGVAPSAMLSLSFLTLLAADIAAKRVEAMHVEA